MLIHTLILTLIVALIILPLTIGAQNPVGEIVGGAAIGAERLTTDVMAGTADVADETARAAASLFEDDEDDMDDDEDEDDEDDMDDDEDEDDED